MRITLRKKAAREDDEEEVGIEIGQVFQQNINLIYWKESVFEMDGDEFILDVKA